MLSHGQQVGKYKIISSIGAGGMGEVFLAEDTELERFAALKILPVEVSNDSNRIQRFIQEAKAASALNHPNILTIYEIGFVNGTRFIASEHIKGKTLREKLKSGSLNLFEAIEIGLQITSALHIAHSTKIIHRDIKPENIMLREDNLVKVLDFGLAKLTERKPPTQSSESPTREQVNTKPGLVLGTVAYMSPEQARGKTVDQRTDIFSLGIVLYEMLTRTTPFSGETNSDVIAAILMKEPYRPSLLNPKIPAELERIISKTLCKNCEQRYQTAADVLKDLKEFKQELDFKAKLEQTNSANEIAEADTEVLDIADTGRTDVIATNSMGGAVSDKIFAAKSTKNTRLGNKYFVPLICAFALITVALFTYFLLPKIFIDPPKSEAVKLFNNGSEALRDGTFYKASKMLEDAVSNDNNFSKAHAGLAEAWMELDYFGRAQTEMLKVNEIQRNNQTFLSSFYQNEDSLYIDAINATVRRDFPQAVKLYEKIVKNNPTESHVYVDLGRALEKNEETDKAIECYEKAINLNAQYGAAFLRLGILRSRKTDYEKSNEAFNKAEIIYDRQSNDEGVTEVKFQRGVSLNVQENLVAARTQFEQVIDNPRANKYQQIRAMLQISSACSGEGKTTCAEDYASKAINLAKDERMENVATNGLIDLGNSFLARGEYDKAEQNFQQALVFARKDDGLRNEARALMTLGSLRIQQKKPDEAINFVNQAQPFFEKGSYKKEMSQANLIVGRANEMKEDYNAALQSFEKVENSESASIADRAYAKMVSGNVLMHQQKYAEAFKRFQQCNELYQSINNNFYYVYSLFYLSDVLFELGRYDEAKDKLVKAQTLLKEGDSLLPSLTTKMQMLNARINLSEKNFAGAIKEAEKIDVTKESPTAIDALMIIGLAQIGLNSKNAEGLQKCVKASQYAANSKDARSINIAKSDLARAFLNSGDYQNALENALQSADYFAAAKQLESGWRALVTAGEASELKGDHDNAKQYAVKALATLSQLQTDWGQENYNTYLVKPDVSFYFAKANKLAAE